MILLNSKEETRKVLIKTASGRNLDGKRKQDDISEENESFEEPKDEVLMHGLDVNPHHQKRENSEKSINLLINKGFETVNKKSLLFLLDEFFLLYLKQLLCLGVIEKKYAIIFFF